jgi:plasmid stabilization system protein ParE
MKKEWFKITYSSVAEKEYVASQEWYNENQIELGNDFMKEVEDVLDLIEQNPYYFQLKKHHVREAPVKKFPFQIVYKIYPKKKEILIISIFHTSRNPKEKQKRK